MVRKQGGAAEWFSMPPHIFLVQWYEVKRVIEEKSEEKRAETVM
jgi:hypothetical protein